MKQPQNPGERLKRFATLSLLMSCMLGIWALLSCVALWRTGTRDARFYSLELGTVILISTLALNVNLLRIQRIVSSTRIEAPPSEQ
jgi:hypothetical protein